MASVSVNETVVGARIGARGGSAKWSSGVGGSYGLPEDVADEALVRLTWMAGLVGLVTAVEIVGHLVLTRHASQELVEYLVMPPMALWMRIFAVIDAIILLAIIKGTRLPRQTKLDLGLLFEIAGAGVMALWQFSYTLAPGSPWAQGGISLAAIWILVWRMVVPTSAGRAGITVLLSAAMVPLALHITVDHGGGKIDAVTQGTLQSSTFLTAGIAWLASRVIYRMGTAVSEARELGAYRLQSRLGQGGMGEVWRASHRILKRPAAIKLIRPDKLGPVGTPQHHASLERFEKEAQATANLESPHTVQLYDFGESNNGAFFYVMELLHGVDLETMVGRYGPMPAERVVFLLAQVCHSLSDAHARGMVHRDVKPANIFVCKLGPDHDFVKVLDFGLVKITEEEADAKLTADGLATGTPAYMAPEVALGEDRVGPATDLYMLGCVAYFMLVGDLVFTGETPISIVSAHIKDEPMPVSQRCELEVPDALEALIMQLLKKDAAERPQSAWEVMERLEAIEHDESWNGTRARQWWSKHAPRRGDPGAALSAPATDRPQKGERRRRTSPRLAVSICNLR